MRAALAVLLASSLAFADPPADAPRGLVELQPGQPAPVKLSCLPDAEFIASEAAAADDHAFRKKAEGGGIRLSPYAVVAIVAGALALGAAVGASAACAKSPDACGLRKP